VPGERIAVSISPGADGVTLTPAAEIRRHLGGQRGGAAFDVA